MIQSTSMKPTISYPAFEQVDIRVGTVVACSAPEWSKKLLRFVVDFGDTIGERVIFSGIKQWYTPDDFVGKQFPFLINLEPKKMNDEQSQGMMLMVDTINNSDLGRPILFAIEQEVAPGSVVR